MAKIEGLKKVVDALRARAAKSSKEERASVAIGYTQKYALFVHENLNMSPAGTMIGSGKDRHMRVGGPKYLETPFRGLASEIRDIIFTAVRKGKTLTQGLLLAGLRVQRESMKAVPIEHGALRGSAFTSLDKNG